MDDPGPGTHHLDVAGSRSALVAKAVLMGDRASADKGDNFHVVMRVGRKAALRRDGIIIPDPDRAPAHPGRFVIRRETEMVASIKPAVVRVAKTGKRPNFNHLCYPHRRSVNAGTSSRWEMGELFQPCSPWPSAR
jgi:hypothetical protein